VTEELE